MFHININSQARRIIFAIVLLLPIFSLCKLNPVHAYSVGTNIEICADNPERNAPYANVSDPYHPILYYWVNNNGFYKYQIQIYRVSDGKLMHDTGEQWEIGPGIVAGSCTFDYPVPADVLPVDDSQYKYMVRVQNTLGDWTPYAEGYFYLYSDGKCGSFNGQTFCPSVMMSPPVEQLCGNYQPSLVTVSGGSGPGDPWTWVCKSSAAGGKDSPGCHADAETAGTGSAGTELTRTICPPGTISHVAGDLCSRYDTRFPPVVSGSGTASSPWTWTCSNPCNDGSGSGSTFSRTISPAINATCGSADGQSYCKSGTEPDFSYLCASGAYNNDKIEKYTEWTWSCAGQCGGTPVNCRAGNFRSCGWIETNP